MNNIAIIGVGRLGLCFALNLDRAGYNIIGIDLREDYIKELRNKTFNSPEPEANELLSTTKVKFSSDITDAKYADIFFICVATPSTNNGGYDHSQIEAVMSKIVDISNGKTIVINCTTMPGYCADLQKRYPNTNITYNPEFIAQGSIIKDQLTPDVVLVGASSETSKNQIYNIYSRLCTNNFKYHAMTTTEAEITKIGLNCFITAKIAMANTIGDLCVSMKQDPDKVLEAIGSDTRIGSKYIKYGFGFGGPCFPRDNRAFGLAAFKSDSHNIMNRAIDESNKQHLAFQVREALKSDQKEYSLEVTYKPNTDIIEESQQLKYAVALASSGKNVTVICIESVKTKVSEKYPNLFTYKII
jgi:UDPglucose 6-dehydrogenase